MAGQKKSSIQDSNWWPCNIHYSKSKLLTLDQPKSFFFLSDSRIRSFPTEIYGQQLSSSGAGTTMS
jgi:hypothetical protein